MLGPARKPRPLSHPAGTLPDMVVTDSQVDNIREDIRALSDTMSDLMKSVSGHDARFDQHDRRFDRIDQTLQQILTLVSGRS
jgi:hypothetical protein